MNLCFWIAVVLLVFLVTTPCANDASRPTSAGQVVVGVHCGGHEDGIAIAIDDRPLLVVEMSKVIRIPFVFSAAFSHKAHVESWNLTLATFFASLSTILQLERSNFPAFSNFSSPHPPVFIAGVDEKCDAFVEAYQSWFTIPHLGLARRLLTPTVASFERHNHHVAHGRVAFASSPYQKSGLVITIDGAGDDGNFNIFVASRSETNGSVSMNRIFQRVTRLHGSLGVGFRYLSEIPQVRNQWEFMGYAALGTVRQEWMSGIRMAFHSHPYTKQIRTARSVRMRHVDSAKETVEGEHTARDWAATVHHVLADMICVRVRAIRKRFEPNVNVEGVAVSGGVAYNIRLMPALQQCIRLPLHVPFAPGDSGLPLGFVFERLSHQPTLATNMMYLGPPLSDLSHLRNLALSYHAEKMRVGQLAEFLAHGWVVGVLRGRSEVGPQSLGHRSIFADALNRTACTRLRNLTDERWFSYLPTMMPVFFTPKLFGSKVYSPHFSFAPRVTSAEWRARLTNSSVCLADGTLAIQTVTRQSEPWLHGLLNSMSPLIGAPILAHGVFNNVGGGVSKSEKKDLGDSTKVQRFDTMINSIREGLDAFDAGLIDGLIVEKYWFTRKRV